MTINKLSKEEGLCPLPFLFFCFMQGRPQYAYATTRGGIRQILYENNRRKETMPDESNKESQKKAGESKKRRASSEFMLR